MSIDEFDFLDFEDDEEEEIEAAPEPTLSLSARLQGGTLSEVLIQLVEFSEGSTFEDLKTHLTAVRNARIQDTLDRLVGEQQLYEFGGYYFSLPPEITHLAPMKA